ncbi:uncharacterized protein MONBRDRAFT_38046 [Monosiga brevicollis MX1]|uniref:J domain-containing protein n=1 Tax=Monosiga brevicollis TaxID=81824 RepID=A9V5D7_MONBE|nr:uncharacterized protein MONBRDRAFT_38046 [Monosiga brevicollis MX1]EDQ87354.1 predicted protein [Monosiga brevicollis MX1]|eukprot:XP_001747967.1 hypothetical protein [Monosiga brevicollis MX1]
MAGAVRSIWRASVALQASGSAVSRQFMTSTRSYAWPTARLTARPAAAWLQTARTLHALRPMHATHYEVLEVSPSATPERIKQAYIELSKRYHPDRNATANADEKENAHRRFQEVGACFKHLAQLFSNSTVVMLIAAWMLIGIIYHYFAITKTKTELEQFLEARSQAAAASHAEARQRARENGYQKQLELLRMKVAGD